MAVAGVLLPKNPHKIVYKIQEIINWMLAAIAINEPVTTNRMIFFISTCSTFNLLSIALFQSLVLPDKTSSVFVLPARRRLACARLLVQKSFLSGSQSCNAKTRFLYATMSLLSALVFFHQPNLRWVYFRFSIQLALDQRGQAVDRSGMVNENGLIRSTTVTGSSQPCRFLPLQ